MKTIECNREQDVIDALSTGRWAVRCDEELRSHVAACSICTDLVEVAGAMQLDYSDAAKNIQVPSAGLVWWRAELRARREAVRTAERPITLVHAFAGACGVGVLAALLVRLSPWLQDSLKKLTGINFSEFASLLVQQHLPVALAFAVLIVLAPVALYFVLSDK